MSRNLLFVPLLLATGIVLAEEAPKPQAEPEAKKEDKELEGMSILGNQEAPKALVIVPWKSSELGDALGIAPMLDDSRGPVDRDVFLRALSYYEIRSETMRHDGAMPSNAAQVTPAPRRSKS
jgi:hypothetical protein